MPSMLSRLRSTVVTGSIFWVWGLIWSTVTDVPNRLRMAERPITIAIRMRKMTTGCGTLLPTASTASRNRSITDLLAGVVAVGCFIPWSPRA